MSMADRKHEEMRGSDVQKKSGWTQSGNVAATWHVNKPLGYQGTPPLKYLKCLTEGILNKAF